MFDQSMNCSDLSLSQLTAVCQSSATQSKSNTVPCFFYSLVVCKKINFDVYTQIKGSFIDRIRI